MEDILLDVTADSVDSDREERLINRYGSRITRSNRNFCITEKSDNILHARKGHWLSAALFSIALHCSGKPPVVPPRYYGHIFCPSE